MLARSRLPGTYSHDAQLDYFRIADDTPGMWRARATLLRVTRYTAS